MSPCTETQRLHLLGSGVSLGLYEVDGSIRPSSVPSSPPVASWWKRAWKHKYTSVGQLMREHEICFQVGHLGSDLIAPPPPPPPPQGSNQAQHNGERGACWPRAERWTPGVAFQVSTAARESAAHSWLSLTFWKTGRELNKDTDTCLVRPQQHEECKQTQMQHLKKQIEPCLSDLWKTWSVKSTLCGFIRD